MNKNKQIKYVAVFIALLSITLGGKAYDRLSTPTIAILNQNALKLGSNAVDGNFKIHCGEGSVECMAYCPTCKTMWEHPYIHGIGTPTGICPFCGHNFDK